MLTCLEILQELIFLKLKSILGKCFWVYYEEIEADPNILEIELAKLGTNLCNIYSKKGLRKELHSRMPDSTQHTAEPVCG